MTTRLTIEYDGTEFAGWAVQPEAVRTVQAELERALAVVLRRPLDGPDPPSVTVAGRTDRGVHAWAQVASYEGDPAPIEALNALLPNDVAVLTSERAVDGFDARRDCTSRAYCYRVLARSARPALELGHVLHWRSQMGDAEIAALHACAALLPGTHDFTAFTPVDTYHVRFSRDVYTARWELTDLRSGVLGPGAVRPPGGGPQQQDRLAQTGVEGSGLLLEFWIEADTFMRHMNRILVGTMLDVARGRRSVEQFAELLEGRSRIEAGPTASPMGLHFAGAGYGGVRVISG